MDDCCLELQVVYQDPPDLVEVEIGVRHGDWSARSTAYASPELLSSCAQALLQWTRNPTCTFRFEPGAEASLGSFLLEFYTIDNAGHARCAVTLATGGAYRDARPAHPWRFAIELRTELGLIERFAGECLALHHNPSRVARLKGLPV